MLHKCIIINSTTIQQFRKDEPGNVCCSIVRRSVLINMLFSVMVDKEGAIIFMYPSR